MGQRSRSIRKRVDGARSGADPEEAEKDGRWERRERIKSKGHCTDMGDDDYPVAGVESRARTQVGFLYRPRWPLA